MSQLVSRDRVLAALSGHMPAEIAQERLALAVAHAGLPEQAAYTPEDVARIGRAFLETAHQDLAPALPELAEIPGPDSLVL